MKFLLIPLVLVAGQALACPDSSKDALAPATSKPVVTAKALPSPTTTSVSTKSVSKVATKAAAEPSKAAPL